MLCEENGGLLDGKPQKEEELLLPTGLFEKSRNGRFWDINWLVHPNWIKLIFESIFHRKIFPFFRTWFYLKKTSQAHYKSSLLSQVVAQTGDAGHRHFLLAFMLVLARWWCTTRSPEKWPRNGSGVNLDESIGEIWYEVKSWFPRIWDWSPKKPDGRRLEIQWNTPTRFRSAYGIHDCISPHSNKYSDSTQSLRVFPCLFRIARLDVDWCHSLQIQCCYAPDAKPEINSWKTMVT